jgi:hypothetical protein
MDGGALTNSLDQDQLVLALSTGLKDWEYLASLKSTEGVSRLLVAEAKGLNVKLCIRTCKPRTFPVNELYHTQLFSSYSLCDPRVSIITGLVKRWARKAGYSHEIPSANCPFSGFHWTILVLFFLIRIRLVPNLHRLGSVATQLPREVFGPRYDRDSFVVITDRAVGSKISQGSPARQLPLSHIIVRFFEWFSGLDVLSECVALQSASDLQTSQIPVKLGWINVVDPCRAGWVSVIDPGIDQKSQVLFALKLARLAKKIFVQMRNAGDERTIVDLITGRLTPDGPSSKVDRAVP